MFPIHYHRCILHPKSNHFWIHFSFACRKRNRGCSRHRKWFDARWSPQDPLPDPPPGPKPTTREKLKGTFKPPEPVLDRWGISPCLVDNDRERLVQLSELQSAVAEEIRETKWRIENGDQF